jgi:hypothetical protein
MVHFIYAGMLLKGAYPNGAPNDHYASEDEVLYSFEQMEDRMRSMARNITAKIIPHDAIRVYGGDVSIIERQIYNFKGCTVFNALEYHNDYNYHIVEVAGAMENDVERALSLAKGHNAFPWAGLWKENNPAILPLIFRPGSNALKAHGNGSSINAYK